MRGGQGRFKPDPNADAAEFVHALLPIRQKLPDGLAAQMSGSSLATLKSGKVRGEEATAELLNLTDSQVRTAVRYYGAFPDEIDRRIILNTQDADEAEAAWQREQAALA
jgi:hypothetical protein